MATITGWERPSTTSLRYTNVAIALHWAIALLILYNLTSGLLHDSLPPGFFAFHVSSGITILALSVLRVVWRLTHRPPPFVAMAPWERGLAHAVHFLLYAAMLLVPLSGWAMISANPPAGSPGAAAAAAARAAKEAAVHPAGDGKGGGMAPRKRGPTMIWGVVKLPMIAPVADIGRTPEGLPRQHALHERIETAHVLGAYLLLALFLLHVAGALKHQFVDRQRELARMGIGK